MAATLAGLAAAITVQTVAHRHGADAATLVINQPMVGMAATPSGHGYWLVGRDGGVFPFGDAVGYGSEAGHPLAQPIVGMASTHDGRGYWLAAADGGVFPFGDATGYGSLGNLHLNAAIVGIAATPGGDGYWLVGADGGVFPFGGAIGSGSTATRALSAPVIGLAPTGDGGGYVLASKDGGVFAFGDAIGRGSAVGAAAQPVVGVASSPQGGYWLASSDGGVFPFAAPAGASLAGSPLNQPIVGVAAAPGGGYWYVARDGGVFPEGGAGGYGSTGGATIASDQTADSSRSQLAGSQAAPVAAGGVEGIIRAAAARHGVSPDYLVRVARCESGLNPQAYNGAGPYIGLFQFLPSTFANNGGHDIYDPSDQSEVAATMFGRGQSHQWGCA